MTSVQLWRNLQKNAEKAFNQRIQLKKLYNKDGLLAIYKPYGIPVHNGENVRFSIVDFFPSLEEKYDLRSGSLQLANRLDKNVAGVLLLTYKTDMAQYILSLQKQHLIEKEYLTIVVGKTHKVYGKLKGNVIGNEKGSRLGKCKVQTITEDDKDSNIAMTEFQILDNNKLSCLLCSFRTKFGQKHQIRVHASELLQCPILGDHKYHNGPNGPQRLDLRMMQLLGMQHGGPVGKIRPWQRALVPMHLFAREVIIPGLKEVREEKTSIKAEIPKYFLKTMKDCDLMVNRQQIEALKQQKPPWKEYEETEFVSRGVSPFHIEKETSF